jgi:8-oxo-dGTP diphosphatase
MIIVTAAIIQKADKILIARRKKGDPLEYQWELPGGKIEPGETPEECLKRELYEEFGIETEIKNFFCSSKYDYPHVSIELLAFFAHHLSGELKPTDHDRVQWARISELESFTFANADIPIIKKLSRASI